MKYLRFIAMSVVTVLVSAVLGYLAGIKRSSDELRSLQSQLEIARSEFARLDGDNRRLTVSSEHHRPVSASKVVDAEPGRFAFTAVDSLRVLADLQQRKLVRPTLTIFDLKGRLDDSFVSLFALTPTEQKRLQQSIDEVRKKLAQL
jgi:hypothetical protein